MISPPTIPTVIPLIKYKVAIFQPNNEYKSTNAISLTIGEVIRKENVTPNGTPDSTKPINIGTVEQEQNGETTPSNEAITFPTNNFLPLNKFFTFSG
jgi:hypothetical protein